MEERDLIAALLTIAGSSTAQGGVEIRNDARQYLKDHAARNYAPRTMEDYRKRIGRAVDILQGLSAELSLVAVFAEDHGGANPADEVYSARTDIRQAIETLEKA